MRELASMAYTFSSRAKGAEAVTKRTLFLQAGANQGVVVAGKYVPVGKCRMCPADPSALV